MSDKTLLPPKKDEPTPSKNELIDYRIKMIYKLFGEDRVKKFIQEKQIDLKKRMNY
jgi:hypothetical protein